VEGQGQVQATEAAPASAAPPTDVQASSSPAAGAAPSASGAPSVQSDFGSPDKFGWDDWDGESYDSFPEPIRPWAERFGSYHKSTFDKQLASERDQLSQVREIYETLMEGREDPRLKAAMDSETKYKTQIGELTSRAELAEKNFKEYQRIVDQHARAEAQRIADNFKAQNPDIFSDPKKVEVLGELLEEDWELENIPKLFQLDPEIRDQVRAAKRDGVSDTWALKLAENWKPKPSKPRAGAELVAGAAAPAPVPQMARSSLGDAKSLDEMRNVVAARAFARSRS
jgi:hypothetical protein